MTLTFEQTINDLIALKLYHEDEKRFNVKTRFRIMLAMVVIGIAVIGYAIYKNPAKADPNKLTYALGVLVFIGLLRSPWVYKYRVKSSISREEERKFIGKRTFIFKEDYLEIVTTNGSPEIAWSQFVMMRETNDYFFLFLALSPVKAFIIPQRIFLLPQEEYDVRSFIERKLAR